jgi:hypothetical protein
MAEQQRTLREAEESIQLEIVPPFPKAFMRDFKIRYPIEGVGAIPLYALPEEQVQCKARDPDESLREQRNANLREMFG